jgi:hypothetical protein
MMDEEPPDLVKGSYKNDLNINKIHEAIILRFQYFHRNVNKFNEKIIVLNELIEDDTRPDNEIKILRQDLNRYQENLNDYQNNISYNIYMKKVKNILEDYNKVASNKSKGIVFFKKTKEKEDEQVVKKRLTIIREYLDIAKEYIRLEIVHKMFIKNLCPGCHVDLSKTYIDEESGLCVCPECGYEKESISHNSTFKDSLRVNSGNRNNYDDCENFNKALLRFQGKQIHRPPVKLYEQLDAYFTRINKSKGVEMCKLPLEDGKRKGTSREMMFEALSETNNSAYYDDINLILHNYWGWDLPNIVHLEDRIMEDYIATQQVYNSITQKDRNASLNIQFRLYVHLKAVDYPCSKSDFKIQTSRDSLIFHNEIWKTMCEKTGVKFHAVI